MQPPHPDILFIVNPNAGKRDNRQLLKKIKRYRDLIDVQFSEYAGHCREIVGKELANYKVFVAAGGDGTVNEVASALAGTGKPVAVYPAGSGNGFAREFGFDRNVKKLLASIENEQVIQTDVLDLNGKISINMAGVGFDSAVAHYFSHLKKRGFLNYVFSTIQTIKNYRPVHVKIERKKETIEGDFFLVSIANTRQFGNNAFIAPEADPQDGRMDLILVSPFPRWLFPRFAFQLFKGTLKPSKYITVVSCKKVIAMTTAENKFHIDGEPEFLDSPVGIKVLKGALSVVDTGEIKFKTR